MMSMAQQAIGEWMDGSIRRIRDMVDANTMVGTPITTGDGVTVIPVSRTSFGFASGSGDKRAKDACLWGGTGAAVKVEPVGFLVLRENSIHMLSVQPPAQSTADRLLDLAPEMVEKIESYFQKKPSGSAQDPSAFN